MIGEWIAKLREPARPELRPATSRRTAAPERIPADRLKTLLDRHRRWLATNGEQGTRLDLRGAMVAQGGGRLANVSLRKADLRGATFRGMTFDNVLFSGALLDDADLSNVNAVKARGLTARQLAGADLSGARLHPGFAFPPLDDIAQSARAARWLFALLLLCCLYTLIGVAGTTDSALFVNSPNWALPVIQAPIHLPTFYWLAPFAIAVLYALAHLQLLRHWHAVAQLPAVYPDGTPVDHRLPPWLLHVFLLAWWPRLAPRRPPLFWLQAGLSLLLPWFLAPLTLLVLWSRYLVRHDTLGTIVQCGVLLSVAVFGTYVYFLARATLRGHLAQEVESRIERTLWRVLPPAHTVGICLAALGLALYSAKAIGAFGLNPIHVPDLSWANLSGADLKSADLTGADLFRTNLMGADLRGAKLSRANLAEAELTAAKLGGADLEKATLREARMERADLSGATLHRADLDEAKLAGATLTKADLSGASIRKSDLRGAALDSARMGGADFSGSDLSNANLSFSRAEESRFTDANLERADLRTINLTAADLTRSRLNGANLENSTLLQIKAPGAAMGEANLRGTDLKFSSLEGADLRQADLARADIRGANLTGAALGKADLSGANLTEAEVDCVRVAFATFDRETRLPAPCAKLRLQ